MTKNAEGNEILTMEQSSQCKNDEVVCLNSYNDNLKNIGWESKRIGESFKDEGMTKYPICVQISELIENGWIWNVREKRCEWKINYV